MRNMNNKTAAILVIGDEILSGRTLDTNSNYLAKTLTSIGVDLKEVRVVGDDLQIIINNINMLTPNYDFVFTSGGIGPTHDDITSLAVSKALDVEYQLNKQAYDILVDLYKKKGENVTSSRAKMAMMPEGAKLIIYEPMGAPGFNIQNLFVLAGVPTIFRRMVDSVVSKLPKGKIVNSITENFPLGESFIAEDLGLLQRKYPEIMMGSYPYMENGEHATSLVLRGADKGILNNAHAELLQIIEDTIRKNK